LWLCLGWGVTALAAPAPLTLGEAMLLALKHNLALIPGWKNVGAGLKPAPTLLG